MKPRFALALVVGAVLVLLALAARGTSPVTFGDLAGGGVETGSAPAPVSVEPEAGSEGSTAAGSLVVVLVLVVAVALIGAISLLFAFRGVRWRRRGVGVVVEAPDVGGGGGEAPAILVKRAAEALEELRGNASGPPGDAVVAAWLALERAAEGSGVPRQGHQTPTEFTGDLLRRYRVDEGATSALKRVYQQARFGTAEVTADDARTATEALAHIVRDLG